MGQHNQWWRERLQKIAGSIDTEDFSEPQILHSLETITSAY
jgi:hypothetical protein